MNISLTPDQECFVQAKLQAGKYRLQYVIFYRISEDRIEILRVVSG